jgi:hypothetical protein
VLGRTIVINTGSRNTDALNKFGHLLTSSRDQLDVELITVWLIDGNRDCLELLQDYLNTFPDARVHVMRNEHCARRFDLYDSSHIRDEVERRGGASLTLPNLSELVMQVINGSRMTFSAAANSEALFFGQKLALAKWRRDLAPICSRVLA